MRNGKAGTAEGGCRAAGDKCQMADDEWQMASDGCRTGDDRAEMADGKCQMADGECRTGDDGSESRSGGCGDGQSGETTPEVSQSPIVGYDSNRVIADSTTDKIGILSHQGIDATDRPYQGDCDRQSLPSGVKTRENAQNEANPESTKSSLPLEVESSETEPAGRKRSQFTQAVASGERQCHVGQAFEPDVSLKRLTCPHEKSSSTGLAFPGG